MTRSFRSIFDALPEERRNRIDAHTAELMKKVMPDGVHLLSEASLNTLERAHIRDQILEARHVKRGS